MSVEGGMDGYQDLLGSAANMQVNAIGSGDDLSDEAMKTLAMLDNTGTPASGVAGDETRTVTCIIAEENGLLPACIVK